MSAQFAASVAQKKYLGTTLIPTLVSVFLVLFLSACSRTSDDALLDYQKRIARLTDAPLVATERPEFPQPPRVQVTREAIPEFTISLVASQRLNRCRAGQLIAERNSSLGRVQPPNARLRHELAMLTALPECLQDAHIADSSIASELTAAIAHKTSTLPNWRQRMITNDPIMRDSLRPGRNLLAVETMAAASETLEAIDYFLYIFTEIERFLAATQTSGSLTAESDLQVIEVNLNDWQVAVAALGQGDFLGRYLRSQQHALGYMQALNQQLTDAGTLVGCRPNHQPAAADYLHNVLMAFWIGELQPMFARWDGYQQQLEPRIQALSDYVDHPQWHAYFRYLAGSESIAQQLQQEVRHHAELWQQVLQTCGLEAGLR
ncbi:DUF3080 family protein [Aliidiomarina haloalkalitolerans]|uniref:DUF3080 domain-containing protein n=1 Tax=Aliidiomarina haloalkalitolerans TaxID=859059 RepID=A0A432VYN2_9GAMM|nr:DUF3080 family protein [Aliidiomarina haloalkalitolerans]MCL4409333.1 DUF3080 domain-containing protein [Gammaproteobacteria bacterium]RUO21770.1 hypothetical protein CWE06_02670 [Aliidiomarina haloalkalitolerans]